VSLGSQRHADPDEGLKKPKVSLASAEKTFMLIRPLSMQPVGRTS
jgi:hypothetical protein